MNISFRISKVDESDYTSEQCESSNSGFSNYSDEDNSEISYDLELDDTGFEREKLDIEEIEDDIHMNPQDFARSIEKYRNQAKEIVSENSKNLEEISISIEKETTIITDDQKKEDDNLRLILNHQLTGKLLNAASLDMERIEIMKLNQINNILKLKNNLLNQIYDSKNTQLINSSVKDIQIAVNELIDKFGEAEMMSLDDDGMIHYTIGDFKEDMEISELGYLLSLIHI